MSSVPDALSPANVSDHRNLVLCFDGTNNQISTKYSNVAQFFALLKKNEPSRQLVYYQTGIGTYTSSNVIGPVSSRIAKIGDSMFAWTIGSHVRDGYQFLMEHYLDGDKISIFGFSRGAYTARALAGMIQKVGLLPRGNHRHLEYAYRVYTQTSAKGWQQAAEFKRCFCLDVGIDFVGIWDTVGSIGFNHRRGIPFGRGTNIRALRQALALDERRALFQATVWRTFDLQNDDGSRQQDVREVWFAGSHSDVGGGSVENSTRHSLSRISLRWMVHQCFLTNTGIVFNTQLLSFIGLDPEKLLHSVSNRPEPPPTISTPITADEVQSRSKTNDSDLANIEEEEERQDALCDIHDQLKRSPFWWILEVFPFTRHFQDPDGRFHKRIAWNLGRPRTIRNQHSNGIEVHRSVKTRIDHPELNYSPRAQFLVEPTWVD